MANSEFKISIITVSYNAASCIERTLQSIKNQSYRNFQYIVIDGNSSDKTLAIVEQYKEEVDILVSEPDKGLYDAMNKGLKFASGEYVCFLNAGDTFYSHSTLEEVFGKPHTSPDIIYGETMIVDDNGNEIGTRRLQAPEILNWKSFRHGMLVCHQSVYVKRSIAESYNTSYKISADYEWVLKALKKANSIHNTHQFLTRFLDGGINKKNIRRGLTERFRIMIDHYGLVPVTLQHIIIGIRFFWFWLRNKRF